VARITLDRPEALNALTFEVYASSPTPARAGRPQGSTGGHPDGRGRAFCRAATSRRSSGSCSTSITRASPHSPASPCDLIRAMRALPSRSSRRSTARGGAGAAIALAADFAWPPTPPHAFLFVKVGLSARTWAGASAAAWWAGAGDGDAHDGELSTPPRRSASACTTAWSAGSAGDGDGGAGARLARGPAAGLAPPRTPRARDAHEPRGGPRSRGGGAGE